MNLHFEDYKEGKAREYGEKFDSSELDKQFISYFESGERIKVKFSCGDLKTGTVGITTGWKPVFILMLTKRSIGSSWTLSKKDKIIAVGKSKKIYSYKKTSNK